MGDDVTELRNDEAHRNYLRALQDEVIKIAERMKVPEDSPTAAGAKLKDLRQFIYPDHEGEFKAILRSYGVEPPKRPGN